MVNNRSGSRDERPPEERPDTDLDAQSDSAVAIGDGGFRQSVVYVQAASEQSSRGRRVKTPTAIPAKGWWDILKRVYSKVDEQNVSILAAGIAFYAMLALFPALGAMVTLYALVSDPADIAAQIAGLATILPPDVFAIIDDQLQSLAAREQQRLGVGLFVGLLFAVWSARRGIDTLVRAVTVAYDERETRGFFKMSLLTFGMTLGAVVLLTATLALLVAVPALIAHFPSTALTTWAAAIGRWVTFAGVVMFALGVLYRYAPPRRLARWRWVSLGAVIATVLWIAGSAAFSVYVNNFGSYNETYGALGAVIVLLLWFYLTAFAIVLGAAFNAETEHQTARDTTVGGDQPLGERGAYVADTIGTVT